MDCQHLQQLLPYLDRPSEELDAVERAAAMRHLANCPDCKSLVEAERRADAAVASVMRDVPVPSDLQQKVLKRLGQRSRLPWKRTAAAIAALVLIGLSVGWYWQRLTPVRENDLIEFADRGLVWNENQVKQFIKDEGLTVELPPAFDFQYVRKVEIVEFNKRRVVKLTFQRNFPGGQSSRAEVIILPHGQFDVASLAAGQNRGATSIQIVHEGGFTYVSFFEGDLENLQHMVQN